MNHTYLAEYIWLDGGTESDPTQNLRSKTRVLETNRPVHMLPLLAELPLWSFDGSSTNQAEGDNSDCVLKPVRLIVNPFKPLEGRVNLLVLCEVMDADETTPHKTNTRRTLAESVDLSEDAPWFGFEQEYTLMKSTGLYDDVNDQWIARPLGFVHDGRLGCVAPVQGPYYCSVGGGKAFGRNIAERHLQLCLDAGLQIYGVNAEVMPGQWEFQIGPRNSRNGNEPLRVSDELWLARWILERVAEDAGVIVSFDPKPMEGDWNGAGMHTNFSTYSMRQEKTGAEVISLLDDALKATHSCHIKEYGHGIERRLTGKHETCAVNVYGSGTSDRGASIRIPAHVAKYGGGYIEDRRPCANADPYRVCARILKTYNEIEFTTAADTTAQSVTILTEG